MLSVTGKGIICKDPELRFTQSGTAICTASLVNNEEYNGEKVAHFTTLKLFGERAEEFANTCPKGALIEIHSGILKHPVNEYKGKKFYNTEVVVLEWEVIQIFGEKEKPKAGSGQRSQTGSNKSYNKGNSRK